jgi:hypothetical protein
MSYTNINKSTDYFNTLLYTGNKTANTTISGVGFQSDFTWIKSRTTAENHHAFDAVRGGGNRIYPNITNAQSYISTTLTSWTSDGFVTGTDDGTNANGQNFVAWNWKANGQGSSNTDGSINTTYTSVNTTSGVSISSYTGTGATATVGHGLGVVPKVVLIKGVSNSGSWGMYHSSIGATKKIVLNTTSAEASSGWMNNTAPTSSVFTVINDTDVGTSGYTYVAYCFAEKQGFSKFGSYIGNGNANGTFVYTGFKPAFVMSKYASGGGTGSWHMYDNKRKGYNTENDYLQANTTSSENSDTDQVDLLSNGFKWRSNGSETNTSGGTFIYMAFGQPIVGTNNIPANAR